MEQDKLKTLELLEEGRISAAEALEILESLDAAPVAGRGPVSLCVRVYGRNSREPRAKVRVPLSWAKFLAPFIEGKIAADLAARGHILDTGKIHDAVQAGLPATIADVRDGGDRVEIFIE